MISVLTGADFSLTCRAIRHLAYYGCIFLLDIFSFSAIYAPTAEFSSTIASDEEMQRECARYVNTRFTSMSPALAPSARAGAGPPRSPPERRNDLPAHHETWVAHDDIWPAVGDSAPTKGRADNIVDGVKIIELYASLKHGQSIKQWYIYHLRELANIDVRRFITFGVIKGFLYRVHKYPFATGLPAQTPSNAQAISSLSGSPSFARDRLGSTASAMEGPNSPIPRSRKRTTTGSANGLEKPSTYYYYGDDRSRPGTSHDENEQSGAEKDSNGDGSSDDVEDEIDDWTLAKYLDGMHCFDQICTDLEISEKELAARLKRYPGEVVVVHR